jgi:hypothetical protein
MSSFNEIFQVNSHITYLMACHTFQIEKGMISYHFLGVRNGLQPFGLEYWGTCAKTSRKGNPVGWVETTKLKSFQPHQAISGCHFPFKKRQHK